MTKLWVDDERPFPKDWIPARTSVDAIEILRDFYVSEMSLDHDLGGDDTTRSVVLWLCEHPTQWPGTIYVHTANPIGREWLEGMVNRYGPGVSRYA